MTKEAFLNGDTFEYKGTIFKYVGNGKTGHINKIITAMDEVILETYECNIEKIGSRMWKGVVFIMMKQVKVTVRYDECSAVGIVDNKIIRA